MLGEYAQGLLCSIGVVWAASAALRLLGSARTGKDGPPPQAAPLPAAGDSGGAAPLRRPCVVILHGLEGDGPKGRVLKEGAITLNSTWLFIEDADGRIGRVNLTKAEIKLVRTRYKATKEQRQTGERPSRRTRWDPSNYLRITGKNGCPIHLQAGGSGTQDPAKGGGDILTSVQLRWGQARELERWHILLLEAAGQAGCTGADWRRSLRDWRNAAAEAGALPAERAAGAVLGRLLYHWQRRRAFHQYIQKKINIKLAVINLPGVLRGSVRITELGLGQRLPTVTAVSAPEVQGGDIALEGDVNYTEGAAWARVAVDLDAAACGHHLRAIPRITAVATVRGLRGRMRVEFTGGGSDYMWLGFVREPELKLGVSLHLADLPSAPPLQRTEVAEGLERMLTAEIAEALVVPRLEDIFVPLINEHEIDDDTWVAEEGPPETRSGGPVPPRPAAERGSGRQPQPPAWSPPREHSGDAAADATRRGSGSAEQSRPQGPEVADAAASAAKALGALLSDIARTTHGEELEEEQPQPQPQQRTATEVLQRRAAAPAKTVKVSAAGLFGAPAGRQQTVAQFPSVGSGSGLHSSGPSG
eukprot:TRINITY_DN7701_c2_g1_i1.p1 TRINITY_DN7701_c2_g1~~TRINITY_DN7701_c2_g1_i1.p1  ORF type:complete len:618 (+),score=133.11 TRINITY_DN7701_c2_g1_i1:94-1854(+)